jgi:hypothetical protein
MPLSRRASPGWGRATRSAGRPACCAAAVLQSPEAPARVPATGPDRCAAHTRVVALPAAGHGGSAPPPPPAAGLGSSGGPARGAWAARAGQVRVGLGRAQTQGQGLADCTHCAMRRGPGWRLGGRIHSGAARRRGYLKPIGPHARLATGVRLSVFLFPIGPPRVGHLRPAGSRRPNHGTPLHASQRGPAAAPHRGGRAARLAPSAAVQRGSAHEDAGGAALLGERCGRGGSESQAGEVLKGRMQA